MLGSCQRGHTLDEGESLAEGWLQNVVDGERQRTGPWEADQTRVGVNEVVAGSGDSTRSRPAGKEGLEEHLRRGEGGRGHGGGV